MAKRAKPGDVSELTTPDGLVYVHLLGKHPEYGDGVAVCPTMHAAPVAVSADLFRGGYVISYRRLLL